MSFDLPPPSPEQLTQAALGLAAGAVLYGGIKLTKAANRLVRRSRAAKRAARAAALPDTTKAVEVPARDPLTVRLLDVLTRDAEWRLAEAKDQENCRYHLTHASGVEFYTSDFKFHKGAESVRDFAVAGVDVTNNATKISGADLDEIRGAAWALAERVVRAKMAAALEPAAATITVTAGALHATGAAYAEEVKSLIAECSTARAGGSRVPPEIFGPMGGDNYAAISSLMSAGCTVNVNDLRGLAAEPIGPANEKTATPEKENTAPQLVQWAVLYRDVKDVHGSTAASGVVAVYKGEKSEAGATACADRFVKRETALAPGKYYLWAFLADTPVGWAHPGCSAPFDDAWSTNPFQWVVKEPGSKPILTAAPRLEFRAAIGGECVHACSKGGADLITFTTGAILQAAKRGLLTPYSYTIEISTHVGDQKQVLGYCDARAPGQAS